MLARYIGLASWTRIHGVLALADDCSCPCKPMLVFHPRGLDVSWPSFAGPHQVSVDGLRHGESRQHLESVFNGLSAIFNNFVWHYLGVVDILF